MSASAILKLQAAGFNREQVEALADLIDTQAASKADLSDVKAELKADIAALEHRLDVKVSDSRTEVIRWVVGMGLAQVGLIITILKAFPH